MRLACFVHPFNNAFDFSLKPGFLKHPNSLEIARNHRRRRVPCYRRINAETLELWFLLTLFSGVYFGKAPRGNYPANADRPSFARSPARLTVWFLLDPVNCILVRLVFPIGETGKSNRQSGSWRSSEFHYNTRAHARAHASAYRGSPGVTWDFGVQGSPVRIIICFQWSSGRGDRGLVAPPRFLTWLSRRSRSISLTLPADSVTVGSRPLGPLDITGALPSATGPPWDQAGFLQLRPDVPDVSAWLTIQNRTPRVYGASPSGFHSASLPSFSVNSLFYFLTFLFSSASLVAAGFVCGPSVARRGTLDPAVAVGI